MKQKKTLILVGCGIKFFAQITAEAKVYIEQSEKVLFLLNNPAMQEWMRELNPNAASLALDYFAYEERKLSYHAITQRILATLEDHATVCVVFYGHPTVFAQSGRDAIIEARKKGIDTLVLPGISAEACLFADLLIDPGTSGCQSFEATDFLLYERKFDPTSHLILWQPDAIGVSGHDIHHNKHNIQFLAHYLEKFYPKQHEIIIYEAAQYPHMQPKIIAILLADLAAAPLSSLSTLYIKPVSSRTYNQEIASILGIA